MNAPIYSAHGEPRAGRPAMRVLFNRNSLFHLRKGRGGYRGAHWHSPDEIHRLFAGLPARDLEIRGAIHCPWGGHPAEAVEPHLSNRRLFGGFLAVAVVP